MKISEPKSDWYIPSDWRFTLSWHFILMPAVILAAMFTVVLSRAAQGDTTLLWTAMVIGAAGVVLLFFARLPLYRQRKFLSFGPRALPAGHRKFYWIAYGFIGISIVIMALILISLNK